MSGVGVVVIGRNEGERLRCCLRSVVGRGMAVVYVDSGSTDGSQNLAVHLGAELVELDQSMPFSAARARNAGFERLARLASDVEYVLFVDGDCEVIEGWIETASEALRQRTDVAAVCGRRRERSPDASIYNRLCDLEWNGAPGEVDSCGGDSLIRVAAFQQARGFDPTVRAGEEPELCQRLRNLQWRILRLDVPMTLHDAAMLHFSQWWRRQIRTGYGAMDVTRRFGLKEFARQVRSAQVWSIGWLAAIVAATALLWPLYGPAIAGGAVLLLLLVVPAQTVRIATRMRRQGVPGGDAFSYGALTMIAKWPQGWGQLCYLRDKLTASSGTMIEYKLPAGARRRGDDVARQGREADLTVAYLVNQYPYVSHSFIRREIAALETQGIRVERYSIRRPEVAIIDPADAEEHLKTRCVLDRGVTGMLVDLLSMALARPRRFMTALGLIWRVGRRSQRGLLRHWAYLAEACTLLRWFARTGVQHVHAHFGTNSTTVAMLCTALGGPAYSFTVHGPEEFDRPELLGLPEKLRRASFVVAVSEFGRSQLYRWSDYDHWTRIHVVRCAVDSMFINHATTAIPDVPRLVCVGRLCEQKGQLVLLEAAKLLARDGMRFEIVLVGDGEMRPQIESQIARFGLKQHVRITGWQSGMQVREAILAARAMVLPSFAEGLPVVIMESLGLGRPVISTYLAGIPELVEPGISGWLVPCGSVDALAAVMRDALTMPVARLEQMGQVGARRVAELHNALTEAAKLGMLFSACIAQMHDTASPASAMTVHLTPKHAVAQSR